MATCISGVAAIDRATRSGKTIDDLFPHRVDVAYIMSTGVKRTTLGRWLIQNGDGEYLVRATGYDFSGRWIDSYLFTNPATAVFFRIAQGGERVGAGLDQELIEDGWDSPPSQWLLGHDNRLHQW